jgi:hypothetical protein
MPWRCPACRTEIQHNPLDARPDPKSEYRCHVCRLDLRFDAPTDRMAVAPLDGEPAPPAPRARVLPLPHRISKTSKS